MRTKTEIIKELNQVQPLCDRLIMDIGQGYVRIQLSNENRLVATVNRDHFR